MPKPNQNIPNSLAADIFSENIADLLAEEGRDKLISILEEAGFSKSPFLRGYEVEAHVDGTEITFTINIAYDGLATETKDRIKKANEVTDQQDASGVKSRGEAVQYVKLYTKSRNGRPKRIQGRYDARKPVRDKRKRTTDKRHGSFERQRKSIVKDSGQRLVEHQFEITNPVGMELEDQRLNIKESRQIRNTVSVDVYPRAEYSGLMSKFLEKITSIIEENFGEEIEIIS